jgi:hypothetical protein
VDLKDMARPLSDVGVRPTCPEHAGSKIYVDRRSRRSSGLHETVEFRCVPTNGGTRHLVSRSSRPRQMADTHPGARQPCPHCGEPHGHGGPVEPYGFTFSLIEVAEAMVSVGRGHTYGDIAAETRRSARRPRQAPRPLNRKFDAKGKAIPREADRPDRKYDYTTAKPPLLEISG